MAITAVPIDIILNFNDKFCFTILIFNNQTIYSVAMAIILLELAIATVVAMGN